MNPYARFGLLSNTVSAAILVGGLATFGLPVFDAITAVAGESQTAMWGAMGGAVTVLVVFWLAMTEAIFPTLFRFNSVRKLVLGKYYVEGTWLQSEKDEQFQRMSVIDIQPDGKSFIFSGYSLNQDLEIESNTLIEFSKFEWPFMTYKYRNSLSDGSDGLREGVGEIQFEMNRSAARRYNGFLQYVRGMNRMKIEGSKLTSQSEVKRLRSLDGRQKIFSKYWELFFERSLRKQGNVKSTAAFKPETFVAPPAVAVAPVPQPVAEPQPVAVSPAPVTAPVVDEPVAAPEPTQHVERRDETTPASSDETGVIPRRRASDWRQDPADIEAKVEAKTKPKASKASQPVASPKVEDVFEDFDDFREDDKETTPVDRSSGASGFRARRRRK